jgi:excisionase family DNA binding protein
MAEAWQSYYTIDKAAELMGLSVDELCRMIREGRVPAKTIGMRMMVPGAAVFGETAEAATEGPRRGERYLDAVRPDLLRMLETAPEFGSCGITVTFHAGKIHKVSTHSDISLRR